MVGHVSSTSAKIWYRPATEGQYELRAIAERKGKAPHEITVLAAATEEKDRCIVWDLKELSGSSRYRYSIHSETKTLVAGSDCFFDTAPDPKETSRICLAFGSCAHSKPLDLWTQMTDHGAQGLVLLGDTPYIDSTKLAVARSRHREFLAVPQLARVIRHTPMWATWDDHDFGANDSDGKLPGKENTRRAFVEYRALDSYGEYNQGIYSKFRYGPVEVFLLDTRWFARTDASPVDSANKTLLGSRQWNWLIRSLQESTAKFKLVTCGMIWDDKENSESDDWGTYTHERTALFNYIGEHQIHGVVLIGGDIHCSRLLKYKTELQVGYPLYQFIVSPIHDSTIPELNVDHPDLVKGAAIPHVWLRLEADSTQTPATLHAEWMQMNGRKMWDIKLDMKQLCSQ